MKSTDRQNVGVGMKENDNAINEGTGNDIIFLRNSR
jgi:hypothetical protein